MEKPLPKDYDVLWYHNWWKTLLIHDYKYDSGIIQGANITAEDILNKLNPNISCRDFVTLVTAFLEVMVLINLKKMEFQVSFQNTELIIEHI